MNVKKPTPPRSYFRVIKLLTTWAFLIPVFILMVPFLFEVYGVTLEPPFVPLSIFVSVLVILMIQANLVLKYYELKKSLSAYFVSIILKAFYYTVLFSGFYYVSSYFSHDLFLFLFAWIVLIPLIAFLSSFYTLFSYKLFSRFTPRPDLNERYAGLIKEFKVKPIFIQMSNWFFALPNAHALPLINKILIVGSLEKILSETEFDAVIIHELAHLRARSKFVLSIISLPFFLTLYFFFLFQIIILLLINFSQEIIGIIVILITFSTILVLFRYFLHKRARFEILADNIVVQKISSRVYYSALKKISLANKLPVDLTKKELHGYLPIKERVSLKTEDYSLLYWKVSIILGIIAVIVNFLSIGFNFTECCWYLTLVFNIVLIFLLVGFALKKKWAFYFTAVSLIAGIVYNLAYLVLNWQAVEFLIEEFLREQVYVDSFLTILYLELVLIFAVAHLFFVIKSVRVFEKNQAKIT